MIFWIFFKENLIHVKYALETRLKFFKANIARGDGVSKSKQKS